VSLPEAGVDEEAFLPGVKALNRMNHAVAKATFLKDEGFMIVGFYEKIENAASAVRNSFRKWRVKIEAI
jgi:hypothetical protein